MSAPVLTIEDLKPSGKRIFLRADMNTPIDPNTGTLLETSRIQEAVVTIRDLDDCKLVVATHQGRVGRDDFVSLKQHAQALKRIYSKDVKFVEDIIGPSALKEISALQAGEVLLLENLRFLAEENLEFSPERAAKTVFVQRLHGHFDACVLDAFPTAHRAHPSIVGFPYLLPTAGGRLVVKELKALARLVTVAKGPYSTVLGGSKIADRLEAIDALIANKRADKVLLCGLIANIFLRAADKIKHPLGIKGEDDFVRRARSLLADYTDSFLMPIDVALRKNGERVEVSLEELAANEEILDIGSRTIDTYSRIIRGSGTVFMSGPPGAFENRNFGLGTESLLRAMASSFGTTIVSGGHLTAALRLFGVGESIDHVSTAGGALVQYLAGKRLPLIDALEKAAARLRK